MIPSLDSPLPRILTVISGRKIRMVIVRSAKLEKLLHVGMVNPGEIIARVKADHGLTISPSLISAIKGKGKKKKRGRKPGRASPNGHSPGIAALLSAKKLVAEVGGIKEARSALDG